MRHLSVPSDQTQVWLERCKANGWLGGSGVLPLDEAHRGVPLNDEAPAEDDPCWEGLSHIDAPPRENGPKHWKERLPAELQTLPDSFWPSSYEIQGDVLLVKLEEEVLPHAQAMARAMIEQMPSVRIVCADEGVHGDFRVRDLRPIASRDGSQHTTTTVREHEFTIHVDPGEIYYSARLSNQRLNTYESLQGFQGRLGTPLVVADPYAGVGPAFPLLLKHEGLVSGYLAGDLNPKAVDLLIKNLDNWTRKSPTLFSPSSVVCKDARTWKEDEELRGKANVVLVNLPHDSFEHLPDLFPLFAPSTSGLLRGWAIIERASLDGRIAQLEAMVEAAGGTPAETSVSEIKGFSTTRCFVVFQTVITWD